jgi:hypothetical protein
VFPDVFAGAPRPAADPEGLSEVLPLDVLPGLVVPLLWPGLPVATMVVSSLAASLSQSQLPVPTPATEHSRMPSLPSSQKHAW